MNVSPDPTDHRSSLSNPHSLENILTNTFAIRGLQQINYAIYKPPRNEQDFHSSKTTAKRNVGDSDHPYPQDTFDHSERIRKSIFKRMRYLEHGVGFQVAFSHALLAEIKDLKGVYALLEPYHSIHEWLLPAGSAPLETQNDDTASGHNHHPFLCACGMRSTAVSVTAQDSNNHEHERNTHKKTTKAPQKRDSSKLNQNNIIHTDKQNGTLNSEMEQQILFAFGDTHKLDRLDFLCKINEGTWTFDVRTDSEFLVPKSSSSDPNDAHKPAQKRTTGNEVNASKNWHVHNEEENIPQQQTNLHEHTQQQLQNAKDLVITKVFLNTITVSLQETLIDNGFLRLGRDLIYTYPVSNNEFRTVLTNNTLIEKVTAATATAAAIGGGTTTHVMAHTPLYSTPNQSTPVLHTPAAAQILPLTAPNQSPYSGTAQHPSINAKGERFPPESSALAYRLETTLYRDTIYVTVRVHSLPIAALDLNYVMGHLMTSDSTVKEIPVVISPHGISASLLLQKVVKASLATNVLARWKDAGLLKNDTSDMLPLTKVFFVKFATGLEIPFPSSVLLHDYSDQGNQPSSSNLEPHQSTHYNNVMKRVLDEYTASVQSYSQNSVSRKRQRSPLRSLSSPPLDNHTQKNEPLSSSSPQQKQQNGNESGNNSPTSKAQIDPQILSSTAKIEKTIALVKAIKNRDPEIGELDLNEFSDLSDIDNYFGKSSNSPTAKSNVIAAAVAAVQAQKSAVKMGSPPEPLNSILRSYIAPEIQSFPAKLLTQNLKPYPVIPPRSELEDTGKFDSSLESTQLAFIGCPTSSFVVNEMFQNHIRMQFKGREKSAFKKHKARVVTKVAGRASTSLRNMYVPVIELAKFSKNKIEKKKNATLTEESSSEDEKHGEIEYNNSGVDRNMGRNHSLNKDSQGKADSAVMEQETFLGDSENNPKIPPFSMVESEIKRILTTVAVDCASVCLALQISAYENNYVQSGNTVQNVSIQRSESGNQNNLWNSMSYLEYSSVMRLIDMQILGARRGDLFQQNDLDEYSLLQNTNNSDQGYNHPLEISESVTKRALYAVLHHLKKSDFIKHSTAVLSGPLSLSEFPGSVSTLSDVQVCVGHKSDWIETDPGILPLWEKVGLEPYSEKKNVRFMSLVSKKMAKDADIFFSNLSALYYLCKFGYHKPHYSGAFTYIDEDNASTKNINDTPRREGAYLEKLEEDIIRAYRKAAVGLTNGIYDYSNTGTESIHSAEHLVVYVVSPFPSSCRNASVSLLRNLTPLLSGGNTKDGDCSFAKYSRIPWRNGSSDVILPLNFASITIKLLPREYVSKTHGKDSLRKFFKPQLFKTLAMGVYTSIRPRSLGDRVSISHYDATGLLSSKAIIESPVTPERPKSNVAVSSQQSPNHVEFSHLFKCEMLTPFMYEPAITLAGVGQQAVESNAENELILHLCYMYNPSSKFYVGSWTDTRGEILDPIVYRGSSSAIDRLKALSYFWTCGRRWWLSFVPNIRVAIFKMGTLSEEEIEDWESVIRYDQKMSSLQPENLVSSKDNFGKKERNSLSKGQCSVDPFDFENLRSVSIASVNEMGSLQLMSCATNVSTDDSRSKTVDLMIMKISETSRHIRTPVAFLLPKPSTLSDYMKPPISITLQRHLRVSKSSVRNQFDSRKSLIDFKVLADNASEDPVLVFQKIVKNFHELRFVCALPAWPQEDWPLKWPVHFDTVQYLDKLVQSISETSVLYT